VTQPAPVTRFTARTLAGLVAVVAAGAGFGLLLALVRLHWQPLDRFDRETAAALNRLVSAHPLLVTILRTITDLGGPLFVTVLVTAAVIGLLVARRNHLAGYLAVTAIGSTILSQTLKLLVGRLRPVVAEPVATAGGNSFPSGHALASTICYGALLLAFLPVVPRRGRPAVIGFVGALVAAVGFTRIALGVHYVSDVVGGWLLGVAWLALTGYAFRLLLRETGRPVPPITEGLAPADGCAPGLAPGPIRGAGVDSHRAGRAAAVLAVAWVLLLGAMFFLAPLVTDHPAAGSSASRFAGRLGNAPAILAVASVASAVAVAVTRSWRPALFVAVVLAGQLGVVAAVNQARHTTFPDGRVAATASLYGAIAVLAVTGTRRWWRWIAVAAAVTATVLVALAELDTAGHRAADVGGGILVAVVWLAATTFLQRSWTPIPGAQDRGVGADRNVRVRDD
jgi:undecaprenyl-diphosphatase